MVDDVDHSLRWMDSVDHSMVDDVDHSMVDSVDHSVDDVDGVDQNQ